VSQVFDAYARYYDLLYRDKDYAAEATYVASHLPVGARILELGCGTGAHAEQLARMGFSVHGVDLSPVMLERAQTRRSALAPDIAARLSFGQGDIRDVRTGKTYDAAISLFHVMSYQTSNDDLTAAFRTAAAHLSPGGRFLFDYWYGPAVLAQQPEPRTRLLEDEEIAVRRIAQPDLRVNENVVDVRYEVQIRVKASGASEVVRETHRMRYLFEPELALLASSAEWGGLSTRAWLKATPPGLEDWSAFSWVSRR
jgi:SAM-dependent methyltransferase